jgi:hypothetical protein
MTVRSWPERSLHSFAAVPAGNCTSSAGGIAAIDGLLALLNGLRERMRRTKGVRCLHSFVTLANKATAQQSPNVRSFDHHEIARMTACPLSAASL